MDVIFQAGVNKAVSQNEVSLFSLHRIPTLPPSNYSSKAGCDHMCTKLQKIYNNQTFKLPLLFNRRLPGDVLWEYGRNPGC